MGCGLNNDTDNLKKCTLCKKELPLTDFYTHRARPDGLYSRCKKCAKETTKKARDSGRKKSIKKHEGGIVDMTFICRKPNCNLPTRRVPIAIDQVDKMKNKFYCTKHNNMLEGDDADLFATSYMPQDDNVSELPFMDSMGK